MTDRTEDLERRVALIEAFLDEDLSKRASLLQTLNDTLGVSVSPCGHPPGAFGPQPRRFSQDRALESQLDAGGR